MATFILFKPHSIKKSTLCRMMKILNIYFVIGFSGQALNFWNSFKPSMHKNLKYVSRIQPILISYLRGLIKCIV